MRFRSVAAAAAVSFSLLVAGCSSTSTAGPGPSVTSGASSSVVATSAPSTSAPATTATSKGSSAPGTTTPGKTTTTSKTTSPAKTTTSSVVQNSLPPATKIGNVVTKRKSVTVAGCKATSGGWEATGTAANASAKKVDYTITIFFTTDKATVQDFAVAKLSVPAKSTAKWSAVKKFKASEPTLCVLRGVA